MNGMKTYILTSILATISGTLASTGNLDPKTGLGGILVAGCLFALRHGLTTSVASIIAALAGVVQNAISSSMPTEAGIAGLVKQAVTEALAEQAAAATTSTQAQPKA